MVDATPPPPATEPTWAEVVGRFWLGLVVLFTAGRIFYLWDYRKVLAGEPWSAAELLRCFASAWRFDASTAAMLLAPLVPLVFYGAWINRRATPDPVSRRTGRTLLAIWGSATFVFAWVVVLGDHWFFVYFKDHFNVFLWEFFEDLSNARLVTAGLGDVVPLPIVVLALGLGWGSGVAWVIFTLRTKRSWLRWGPKAHAALFVPLYVLAARGTFDARPLPLQDRRITVSRNSLINLLHTNPFIPLYRSWQENRELAASAVTYVDDPSQSAANFTATAAKITGAEVKESPDGYRYLSQTILPAGAGFLQRRPKHVVLLFMESYARWLLDHEDEAFAADMGQGYRAIKAGAILGTHHFSPAGGTIKNIAAANLGFPVARDFHPSLVYHKEGYKAFPGRLAPLMKAQGYEPRFFYGGVAAWHRLYQFVPALGYAAFSAEHSYPERPHHEHGLYDGDLLEEVLTSLRQAEGPTFSFVMSLTNHPPFSVPQGEEEPPIHVPASLKALMLDDPAQLERRFIAYRYADRSLLRFVQGLAAAGLAKDTLVVVTGDHAFSGGLGFAADFGWKAEQVPLLFWGPEILKPEFVGSSFDAFTTHLDLAPTLVSLTTEVPVEIQAFGKVVFDPRAPATTGINHYFSCKDGLCLKDGRVTRLDEGERLVDAENDIGSATVKHDIEAMEHAYFGAAMSYLYTFKEPATSALKP